MISRIQVLSSSEFQALYAYAKMKHQKHAPLKNEKSKILKTHKDFTLLKTLLSLSSNSQRFRFIFRRKETGLRPSFIPKELLAFL